MFEKYELSEDEKRLVEIVAVRINGDRFTLEEYEEPAVPHTVPEDVKLEYLTKALSEHELGRYIAHRVLDPTFTEVKKDE